MAILVVYPLKGIPDAQCSNRGFRASPKDSMPLGEMSVMLLAMVFFFAGTPLVIAKISGMPLRCLSFGGRGRESRQDPERPDAGEVGARAALSFFCFFSPLRVLGKKARPKRKNRSAPKVWRLSVLHKVCAGFTAPIKAGRAT